MNRRNVESRPPHGLPGQARSSPAMTNKGDIA
jgi:hypothetical protein